MAPISALLGHLPTITVVLLCCIGCARGGTRPIDQLDGGRFESFNAGHRVEASLWTRTTSLLVSLLFADHAAEIQYPSAAAQNIAGMPRKLPAMLTATTGAVASQKIQQSTVTSTIALTQLYNSTATVGTATFGDTASVLTIYYPASQNIITSQISYGFIKANATSPVFFMGGLFELTKKMGISVGGLQQAVALKCQLSIVNGNEDILPNSFIAPQIFDTGSSTGPFAEIFAGDIQHPIIMSIGPSSDTKANIFNGVVLPMQLPFIVFDAGSTAFNDTTNYPSLFRSTPSDKVLYTAILDTALLFNWTSISVVATEATRAITLNDQLRSNPSVKIIEIECSLSLANFSEAIQIENFIKCISDGVASVIVLDRKLALLQPTPFSTPPRNRWLTQHDGASSLCPVCRRNLRNHKRPTSRKKVYIHRNDDME